MLVSIYIDRISYPVTNLGPGKRIGIWVQGCSRHCQGCMSPHVKIQKQENLRSVDSIFNEIFPIARQFDGVTVSGGEALEQADALTGLLMKIRKETNLDILVYTGYTLDKIKNGSMVMKKLLNQIDILIDGPFMEHLPNTKI
jgi:anaerobic ribonucleoside-triphosphate reductase activating protein